MYIRESANLAVSNPVLSDFSLPMTEALLADLKISEVRAIYPMIRAINSGRLTRNFTYYPAESLIGKNKKDDPTGYASFVKPYGKPIIREHQAQKVMGMMGPIEEADVPMGRVIYAGFRRWQEKKDGPRTTPKRGHPGTVEGDGTMFVVPAITDPESITRILGGAYHTVSIGSKVDNVIESISNQNIAQLRRDGKELPPYERGQMYKDQLSYWKMGEVRGVELSFVNVPSDEYAGVADPDIGIEGIRLLVAEKKPGAKEFAFYDAKTAELVEWNMDEYSFDESHFIDSAKVGHNIWWLNKEDEEPVGELINEKKEGEEPMEIKDILEKTLDEIINLYPEASKTGDALKESLIQKFSKDTDVTNLVEGKAEAIEQADLFAKVTDFAVEVVGDWNEVSAKFALGLYLENGGTVAIPEDKLDTKVTVGELYGISGDLAALETTLTHAEWKELPEACFVGPDRTIPITNFESALYAAKLFSEDMHPVHNRIWKEFGIVLSISENADGTNKHWHLEMMPAFVEPIGDATAQRLVSVFKNEDVDPLLENVDAICERYSLNGDQKVQIVNFLEKCKGEDIFKSIEGAPLFAYTEQSVQPVVLGTAFLLEYFINNEVSSDNRTNLATLVGLVRKNGFTKEDLDGAFGAYNVFGTSVLRKFLETVPERKEENLTETQEELTPSVETIPDPVAATEQINDGPKKESKTTSWYGLQTRPKRSGKNPVINKEKR